ncbi:hypothetical protein [Halosegnis rubeus]|uniref:Concanavalin A-like lectin/glucanases superfamily protein n=1 Tax=Halosegnis rubeus TaxID=2212850 RepID=A0A5N5UKK0_9EURY|nr:hypothetical protein [Halosegnis rubeus]KAB7518800.1 hypothetical protein DP108_06435 [Halosegnis rubeus]
MAPIRKGDGTGFTSKGFAGVRKGDGTILYSAEPAIPDSVVAQWDARDLSGYSDGDAVTSWDATVGSFTASGDGVYRPLGVNGNPSVGLDGTDDGFTHGFVPSEPSVLFAVIEPSFTDSTTNSYKISSFTSSIGGTAHSVAYEGDRWILYSGSIVSGSTTASRQLVTVRFDESNSFIREDGAETGSGSTGQETPIFDSAFGFDVDSGGYFDGNLAFLEYHDGTPSNGLTTREQEIADDWGITL